MYFKGQKVATKRAFFELTINPNAQNNCFEEGKIKWN